MTSVLNDLARLLVLSEVVLERDKCEGEEQESRETHPPGKCEVDPVLSDNRLVKGQEGEQHEHDAGCYHPVNPKGLLVAILVWAHMVQCHGLS